MRAGRGGKDRFFEAFLSVEVALKRAVLADSWVRVSMERRRNPVCLRSFYEIFLNCIQTLLLLTRM